MNSVELRIMPFPGFYGSSYSSLIDNERDWALNDLQDKYGLTLIDDCEPERGWYSDCETIIAKSYTEIYLDLISEYLGISFTYDTKDVRIWSPKYYNFNTDEIYVKVSVPDINDTLKVLHTLTKANYPKLEKIVKNEHSSCSGFISFMSNDLDEWDDDKLLNSDRPYLSCLIGYLLYIKMCEKYPDYHEGNYIDDIIFEFLANDIALPMPNIVTTTDDAEEELERCKAEYEAREQRRKAFNAIPPIPGLF
jgi:hypothetical protein